LITILVDFHYVLMFPTIRGWDEFALSKRCILYQDVKTLHFLLHLFTEGVDRGIAREVEEKEFNVFKLCRFLDFFLNASAPVSITGGTCGMITFDGLFALGFAPTRDYQPFWIHGSEMFGGFETKSDVRPSDQYDLAGEVFSHERHGVCPLFSQESEEGVSGHELRFLLGGGVMTPRGPHFIFAHFIFVSGGGG